MKYYDGPANSAHNTALSSIITTIKKRKKNCITVSVKNEPEQLKKNVQTKTGNITYWSHCWMVAETMLTH